jgi:hypothetical protein
VQLGIQIIWLFVLAIPIASIAWTVTHEEIFRGSRNYCAQQSESSRFLFSRKFFFIFTCEFCFSHYVTILFLWLTRYKLLFDDWRGYLVSGFALVWVANQYMSVYGHLRLDIRRERVEIKHVEQKVEAHDEQIKSGLEQTCNHRGLVSRQQPPNKASKL